MTGLRVSRDLLLPEDAVTETFAILAKRGKGKTNTAVVMAEEMIRANLPVVVIDPVGVWWGLRSSADGTSAGLPVVIFGGDHADVPLEETAGKVLADVVVDERIPTVIDTSSLSKSATRRFMADSSSGSTTATATRSTSSSMILAHLVEQWPDSVTKDDLAAATEYAANGGGFNNALGRLRGLELIEGRGDLRAADVLGQS